MEGIVASLTRNFGLVPPAAAPAIVDCVLAAGVVEPAVLFSSLLDAFPDPSQVLEWESVLSHGTALCHLVKNTRKLDQTGLIKGSVRDSLQLFTWRVFVPMVKSVNPNKTELLESIVGLLCDVVSSTDSWELMAVSLVPFCFKSVGSHLGISWNEDLTNFKWDCMKKFEHEHGSLSLLVSCCILTSVLNTALINKRGSLDRKFEDEFSDSESFGHKLMWDLSNMALCMLKQGSEHQSCAIHLILPHLLRFFNDLGSVRVMLPGSPSTLSRVAFLSEIWKSCLPLFSLGHEERIVAYNVLSLCFFSLSNVKENRSVSLNCVDEAFDLTNEKEFWEEIRKGLVEKDAFLRKQALYVLRIALNSRYSLLGNKHGQCRSSASIFSADAKNSQAALYNGTAASAGITKRGKWAEKEAKSLGVGEICHLGDNILDSQERWKVFLLLYEMLEEYGIHLVEAAWTHQVSLLFQPGLLKGHMNPATCGVYHGQMETLDGIFSWLAVLWERGLFHENPQVRCLIMQSFLSIAWEEYEDYAHNVPRSFVLGPLLLGLNDAVHHKDFGVKGVYTSKTIHGAAKFFHGFSFQMSFSDRVDLLCTLASKARQELFGRAGLMALAFCIASAAGEPVVRTTTGVHDNIVKPNELKEDGSFQGNLLSGWAADLLDALGIVVEKSKKHFNPCYRLTVCEQVLKTASSVISICDVPLSMLLHFLSNIPREFTDFAGSLRGLSREWLTQASAHCHNSISDCSNMLLLESLAYFPRSFIKHQHLPDVYVSFDDEDVDAWKLEAQRWARVLFLATLEEQHLEPIFMFIQNCGSRLCTRDLCSDWLPIKLFILILSLFEEFETGWKRFTNHMKARAGKGVDWMNIFNESAPLFNSSCREYFIRNSIPILDDLLPFAKSVSEIFWSRYMVDTELPCVIKGKLGGPSQRRLASHTSSAVLQAASVSPYRGLELSDHGPFLLQVVLIQIFSVRSLSSISSLCLQLKSEVCLDSMLAFLWEFSMKVIRTSTYECEAGAELHLAAYESLVYVFKAFSTAFSPSIFDFVLAFNNSQVTGGESVHLLDPLVQRFLWNINGFIADGVLTRSRRAVLLNWKWLCLDSLLHIPNSISESGSHAWSTYTFFSELTLTNIVVDIIESLENACEGSVLPMLRSIRLILWRLYPCKADDMPQLSSGVDHQLMMQLVNSSWVLLLSCNKRRVAPIAALLSAVLHPSLFCRMDMHETSDGKQGPFKLFIRKLLEEGAKSPRTMRLAALHLTGLWLVYPGTIKFYLQELKLLTLYGSVAFDEDFEAELTENLEARSEVLLLAQIPNNELSELFINTEMYARVSVAVLFYKLAHSYNRGGEDGNTYYEEAYKCGKIFLLELLGSVVNDKDLAKELYKKFSGVHRRKVRVWQMICILSLFVDGDIVHEVTTQLHICLFRNNLPAVRQYLETFAIQIYLKFPMLAEEQLIPIFYNYNMRPQAISSYVFIAANVILHAGEASLQMKHLCGLLPPIIPFLTSHHHSLRGFTQLLVHHVLCKLWSAFNPINSETPPFEKKCFEDLKSYLANNPDCVRLRASMEGLFDVFDPILSATPAGIFSTHDKGRDFECVPISLMEQVNCFLNDVRDDLRDSLAKDAMSLKNEILRDSKNCNAVESLHDCEGRTSAQTHADLEMDFQKKISVHEHAKQQTNSEADCFLSNTELTELLLEMENEDEFLHPVIQSKNLLIRRTRDRQQQFILVASLLDRIPNLAGLARTCEVFKAAGLAVADASIVHDKQFQLISVTAEKWVPIIEVPVSSMKVFLEKKRGEGFSILGLEQTANSTRLDQYPFSCKTVLVLGREKEGIPVDILHVLDACVEIPQLGIVRSLNVHVSGAIALWEYARQHKLKQP